MSWTFLKDIKVPGVVPSLVLVIILALIHANVADPLILEITTMLVITILKAIQVNVVEEVKKTIEGHRGTKAPTTYYQRQSKMFRWMWG